MKRSGTKQKKLTPDDILEKFTDKQREATAAADRSRYVLYGGARGPGKSYWLRWWLLRQLLLLSGLGLRGVRVGLFCENYPVLRDRQISKIEMEFPRNVGELKETQTDGLGFHLHTQYGSGVLCLRNLDDPRKYQSAEFAAIGVDELTKNSLDTFNILRGSLRWPGVDDTRFVGATNPGDIGHLWVKQYWIDKQFPAELQPFANQFVFVRALPSDNPHLAQSYWDELNSLPPELARAWVHGDWDVFAGQAFSEWVRDEIVVEPRQLPFTWPRWRCVDWGYAKPFCCLWLAQDPDTETVYVYRELYQVGLTDREQAKKIKDLTIEDIRFTLADPSMWTRKSFEGQTFSTADEYAAVGVPLTMADNNRLIGVRKVRQVIHDRKLKVFSTCPNLIRTLPALPYSKTNLEDVDTDAEDHAFDTLKYGLVRGAQKRADTQYERGRDPYAFVG